MLGGPLIEVGRVIVELELVELVVAAVRLEDDEVGSRPMWLMTARRILPYRDRRDRKS